MATFTAARCTLTLMGAQTNGRYSLGGSVLCVARFEVQVGGAEGTWLKKLPQDATFQTSHQSGPGMEVAGMAARGEVQASLPLTQEGRLSIQVSGTLTVRGHPVTVMAVEQVYVVDSGFS